MEIQLYVCFQLTIEGSVIDREEGGQHLSGQNWLSAPITCLLSLTNLFRVPGDPYRKGKTFD